MVLAEPLLALFAALIASAQQGIHFENLERPIRIDPARGLDKIWLIARLSRAIGGLSERPVPASKKTALNIGLWVQRPLGGIEELSGRMMASFCWRPR